MNNAHNVFADLAAKINGLDLTDDERHALEFLIVNRGEQAEVSGFGGGVVIGGVTVGLVQGWPPGDVTTEEVAFYFDKIDDGYGQTQDGSTWDARRRMDWGGS